MPNLPGEPRLASDPSAFTDCQAPHDSEHLLSLLIHLPDAVLFLDRDWRITFANDEARRISRIAPEDLNSKTHWELYPEAAGTEFERACRAVMDFGSSTRVSYFHAPFDLWVNVTILPLPNGVALCYRDITALKRAEELRDTAIRQLNQVFEAAADSIVCIDRNWKCIFANRVAHQILKTPNLVGMDLWLDFPGNQQEPFASNYRATMDQRTPTEFEAYYPEPLDIWFKVLARPYEDGILIFSNDITDRKRAEALRDASVKRLNQVLEVTTDCVFSLDRNWNLTFCNTRARALLGREDLLGKNLWEEFPAALDSIWSENYHRTMDQGVASDFDAFYPEPLNLWFSVQCRPADDGIVIFFRDITARRHSDSLLRKQRDLITFVQQAARTAFWNLDLATGSLTFDSGSYPVYGHPFSRLANVLDFRAIVHPDDSAQVQADVQRAVESGDLIVNEFRVIDQNGKVVWIEARSQTACTDGKPVILGGMAIDITERKHNQEALAASEERYRVLTELSPQFLWTGSPQGDITYANQGFLDYLGFTLADIGSEKWLTAFIPEDRPRVLEAWTRSVTTGVNYEIEARTLSASGEPRWWWLRALPLRDEAGNIVNWLGVAIDIHDRKTAADTLYQKQLETERQRAEIEAVYRTAPIGLAFFDPVEFRYLRLNDRQAEIVGLPIEQVLGRTLTEIAPIPGLREMFQQVAAGRPIRNALLQGELPTRPGEHRFWNVNYFPVYNADGSVQAISAASLEVTNQKKAEIALIQSEKLAAVGRLASSISHEINNPLEAVTNLLYLIAHNPDLSGEIRPYVDLAQGELQRVCQIATQTLRFHRQAARATLVTPEELATSVVNLYQGRLVNSGIFVEARYNTRTPILCFENDIRQVLNNIIANAIDAMRHGGHLIIRAHNATGTINPPTSDASSPQPANGVRITIADTGHGMPPAVRARSFEPFYTTKDLNGTGLGLWISNGIVARHRGRITVRSSVDPQHHGTVFSIFLPHIAESDIEETDTIPL